MTILSSEKLSGYKKVNLVPFGEFLPFETVLNKIGLKKITEGHGSFLKAEKQKNETNKKPIKTWSRKSTIIPDFIGLSFLIYNGKKFIPLTISEDMVGHKFGEFAPTRQFSGHTPADKKAKADDAKTGDKK